RLRWRRCCRGSRERKNRDTRICSLGMWWRRTRRCRPAPRLSTIPQMRNASRDWKKKWRNCGEWSRTLRISWRDSESSLSEYHRRERGVRQETRWISLCYSVSPVVKFLILLGALGGSEVKRLPTAPVLAYIRLRPAPR